MNDTRVRMRLLILLSLAAVAVFVWFLPIVYTPSTSKTMYVHFLDVGQGDAIFIETPDGIQVLVDGGSGVAVLRALSRQMSFFDRRIDMVIGTHPDSDHIGGLVAVLQRYAVGSILRTEKTGTSATWNAYTHAIDTEHAPILFARQGQVFHLGESVVMKVLYPQYRADNLDSNVSSIVIQIVYGNTSILLTGDSPKRIEQYLVHEGIDVQSDVLKVGHHGSRTSTSELFLAAVDPEYVVISAGKDNRYGHPHHEVTDLLDSYALQTVSTAQEGTITFVSDGRDIWMQ